MTSATDQRRNISNPKEDRERGPKDGTRLEMQIRLHKPVKMRERVCQSEDKD